MNYIIYSTYRRGHWFTCCFPSLHNASPLCLLSIFNICSVFLSSSVSPCRPLPLQPCVQYWPEPGLQQYGPMEVEFLSMSADDDVVTRLFRVKNVTRVGGPLSPEHTRGRMLPSPSRDGLSPKAVPECVFTPVSRSLAVNVKCLPSQYLSFLAIVTVERDLGPPVFP